MIWQTKKWGEMLVKSGQAEKIIEIDGVFIEKRKVSMGEYGLFVLGLNSELSVELVNKLTGVCKKEDALFLQVESLWYSDLTLGASITPGSSNNLLEDPGVSGRIKLKGKLKNGYYKKFITPYTAIIDLNLSEEDILKAMKPKGRYNIKLAVKKGVEVEIVEKTDENIAKFYDLIMETTSRDGFSGNNLDYYKTFLSKLDNSELLLAYKDDEVISAGIFIFDREVSIYYYGASTSKKEYRNLMAPYLLQWEAIKKAKSVGSQIYDFLGVAGPNDDNSSLSGVTDFKKKLTPNIIKVSDSMIYINKSFKYSFIKLLRKLKK